MKLPSFDRKFHQKVVLWASEVINLLLYLVVIIALLGIGLGIYHSVIDILHDLNNDTGQLLETLIINSITILAVIEVIRVILSYLTDGRVKVSLVIDTVLIVMLNEMIREWFEGSHDRSFLYLVVTVIALMGLRIAAIRFGPSPSEKEHEA